MNYFKCLEIEQQAEPVVTWGVDWGKDEDWVSIVKRHPDGTLEVVATEGRPVKQQAEPVAIPGAILMGQVAARSRSIPERAAAVGDAE
jgi:hypothetical protein